LKVAAGAFLATSAVMRITATLAGVLLLFGVACSQKTETTTTTDAAGNVQQQKTTTVTATVPSIDTTATAEAKQDVKAAAKDAANAARDAAHATGTAMETTGKAIQKRTKRH
jgi:cytoskeletal protein RodZ